MGGQRVCPDRAGLVTGFVESGIMYGISDIVDADQCSLAIGTNLVEVCYSGEISRKIPEAGHELGLS